MPLRHLLRAALVLALCLPALAAAQDAAEEQPELPAVTARPAIPLPAPAAARWVEDVIPDADTLSAPELARRIARLYGKQAELLTAEAEGDADQYAALLEGTMQDLQALAMRPGVLEQPRFRELYRSVLMEYEVFHGESPDFEIEAGEIYDVRAEMFSALASVEEPLLENVELPGSVMATFPMTINRAVESQIRFYLRKNRHLERVRERASTYFPMIEQVLAEEGVPDELKYLAVIESALNQTARSWAGAAGMWQFIPATGRHSGLTVTRELDERLDPEKATRAAARHLNELYAMFGDWQLAIAGYNCNPAKIRREVRRAEQRNGRPATFWDIYNHIPRETRGYVPAFIAVSLIMSNPEAFGLDDVTPGPSYEFDVLPVEAGTSLGAIAERVGVSRRTLEALNPALRRSRVPSWTDGYPVRIPAGHYARYAADLADVIEAGEDAPRTVAYRASNRRVIAFAQLEEHARSGPSAPAIPVSELAAEHRRGRTVSPPPAEPEYERIRYRVRRGDTLIRIARRHGVTVRQLREWNNIRGSHIRIGQRLTIMKRQSSRS